MHAYSEGGPIPSIDSQENVHRTSALIKFFMLPASSPPELCRIKEGDAWNPNTSILTSISPCHSQYDKPLLCSCLPPSKKLLLYHNILLPTPTSTYSARKQLTKDTNNITNAFLQGAELFPCTQAPFAHSSLYSIIVN